MLHRRYLAGPAAPARGRGAALATEAVQMGNPGMSPRLTGSEVAVASVAAPRRTPRRETGNESATSSVIFVPLLARNSLPGMATIHVSGGDTILDRERTAQGRQHRRSSEP